MRLDEAASAGGLLAQRSVSPEAIHQVVYANALAVYGLNGEMMSSTGLRRPPSTSGRSTKATRCCARRPDAAYRRARPSGRRAANPI